MTALAGSPSLVVRLGFECEPVVEILAGSDTDAARLFDWLGSREELREIVDVAFDGLIAARERIERSS